MIIDVIIMKLGFRNETFIQGFKYLFVGGICTVLDFGILFSLTHFAGVHYVVSSIISFSCGTILNYFLCIFWIFKIRVVENRPLEFIYYLMITGVGLGINTFLVWGITSFWGLYYMVSKAISTFATYWWNFAARKYFLHTIR